MIVTGPARSGKSEWAEMLAIESGKAVVYVATAQTNPADAEWTLRIAQHQDRRPQDWVTREVRSQLAQFISQAPPNICLLVDSLGSWVANLLEQDDITWDKSVEELLAAVRAYQGEVIFVAEETGWGVVPAYPMGRQFRDRLGSLVRQLGTIANPVYLVTGGHVLNLSLLGHPLPEPKR